MKLVFICKKVKKKRSSNKKKVAKVNTLFFVESKRKNEKKIM